VGEHPHLFRAVVWHVANPTNLKEEICMLNLFFSDMGILLSIIMLLFGGLMYGRW